MTATTDPAVLEHLAYSIFLPPKLPQEEQDEPFQKSVDLAIIQSVIQASQEYSAQSGAGSQWGQIESMLQRLHLHVEAPLEKTQLYEEMKSMEPKGRSTRFVAFSLGVKLCIEFSVLHIRAQNTGLIIRKQVDYTTFEAFEVQAQTSDIMSIPAKYVRHFPGPVVRVPNSVAGDNEFIKEVSNILAQASREGFEKAHPKTRKAGVDVHESRDSVNPNYFIQYFFGFLRGMGTTIDPLRVPKRLADEVLWMNAKNPWRRSPIWLIVRVALQTSLDSAITYKHFMAYHHASVLSHCYKQESFSSDLLYAMRIKMARRLYKVQDTAPPFITDTAKAAANGTQHLLQRRWDAVQSAQAESPNRIRPGSDFESAINQTLPNSSDYLQQVFEGRSSDDNPPGFNTKHSLRLENIIHFSQYAKGALSQAFKDDRDLALFDFEASVFNNLSRWISSSKQQNCSEACAIIYSCFRQYLVAAKSYYTTDIADQSIMILTLLRLWMAIDELAITECPLLSTFSPELPEYILDSLLLHTAQHIEQARIIQQYIRTRHDGASSGNPSIFSDKFTPKCFAVRYFESSQHHQQLKMVIEAHAQECKNQKIKELEELNAQHKQLGEEIQGMAHHFYETSRGRRQHSEYCERCLKEKKKNGLGIQPYEWPLPRHQPAAKAVVFELDRPKSFIIWRDITYEILVDLGTLSPRCRGDQRATLEEYGALAQWLVTPPGITTRIIIASVTKSFKRSHYNARSIPATESQVCLKNALMFKFYDKDGEAWATGPFPDVTFAKFGTLKLPAGSLYHHLEYTLGNTAHTSNELLANQYDCPKELSLHEHIAFGTLRSGARLQWMNIVRGLEENLLTFNSDEVRLLHTQAAWQIGPLSDDGSRQWHEDLNSLEFGCLLISQCQRVLNRVRANWLQANAVLIIVMLASRLFASLPSTEVVRAACDFLREARTVAYKWLGELEAKLKSATGKDIIGYQYRVCEMAIICRATYDVEPHHMDHLLSTSNDYAILIECSIRLYDNRPPNIQSAPATLQNIMCRDRRFSHKSGNYVLASVRRGVDVLSAPLSKVWPNYRQGLMGWRVLESPDNRWITTTTTETNEYREQEVHLNILTGELQVDGRSLGRLPRYFIEHATYIRLFGQTILDVVLAKSPGMRFTTRDRIHGYEVSFALKRKQLAIQAQKDGRLYELIPHEKLSGDFPLFFSTDYHHWANLGDKTVEFRPLSSPWSADEYQWRLRFNDSQATTLESSKGDSFLIDIHSVPFKLLSLSIGPLESDWYIHVTYSSEGLVEVELPRMKFSFFINEDKQLESRNFQGQILDENQSAGTLFGLKNQLLLRAKGAIAQSLPRSRSVLIPDGEITFATHGHHVSVSVQSDSRRNVEVYHYKIDNDLKYLATDSGLTSRLFKVYLHALTSYCLPDPLTGRTGTEEALDELSHASTSSFEQINIKQAGLLKAIGSLTPKREYYPPHLQRMQTTYWANLPPLSQHFAFSLVAAEILRRADTLQLFYPLDFKLQEYIAALETSGALLKRAARRTVMYYPPTAASYSTHIIDSLAVSDTMCPGRDSLGGDWEEAGQVASWASGMAHQNWRKPVFKPYDLVSLAESWGTLNDPEKYKTLSYDSSWLSATLGSCWINLYNLLRRAGTSSNRYMLSAHLASVAFGKTMPTEVIPVFLAFATNPKFRALDPPLHKKFVLKDGYEPTIKRVEEIVSAAAYSVESSPAGSLPKSKDESDLEFRRRREGYYHEHLSNWKLQLVDTLMSRWSPINQQTSIELGSVSLDCYKWFDVESCLKSTGEYFSSCVWNIKMKHHLRELEAVLASCPTSPGVTFTHVPINQKQVHPAVIGKEFDDSWNAFNITNLMHSRPPPDPIDIFLLPKFSVSKRIRPATDTSRLASLLAEFQQSRSPLNRQYGANLDKSRIELDSKPSVSLPRQFSPSSLACLDQARGHCMSHLTNVFQQINSALSPQTDIERIIFIAGVWPRITSRTVLQLLSLQNRTQFDSLPKWRSELIGYAQGFADYQKSQRLIALAESENIEEFYKELDLASSEEDPGTNDPDWLLIDGNFSARAAQRQVAQEMISPSLGSNTVLQLNMGEGKSSVIVPIIASCLADSSRLVRVVVLKPLWRQMFELLVNRLSSLSNRRIYYLPFGRHIQIDSVGARKLRYLYEECMREGGILLAQPEHILSFKLMGIDRLISSGTSIEAAVANDLRNMQGWLKDHTRDILDESDEVLHVRYQLVYTVGEQQPLDDHPDRWTTTQHILHLAATHIKTLQKDYPDSVLYTHKACGQFPTLRILPDCQVELEKKLISAIANRVLDGQIPSLNCDRLPPPIKTALHEFFTNNELPYPTYDFLQRNCDPTIWKGLLLVRGLLASGILIFALKRKHYRVDYGLDLNRSFLAVPYRAKDIPSLRAEFGHPDVAVVLTCLSYYYHGLTEQHLDLCFKLLFKLDNPALEYDQWVKRNEATPDDLKQLNGVNIKDRQQFIERISPNFSRNAATVDFFLSSVVFPKDAKGFPKKLATSGWDLAERKHHVTTGFSGTNDNRCLLPTSITQADPGKQLSTNALVLTFLLQPENNCYVCMRDAAGGNLNTEGFMKLLVAQIPEVRVLLDVGAQVLELQNEELVRYWLGLKGDIEAAVYFNNRDELVVLPQGGTPVLLNTSPFAQRLDKCIVYLDDGHTRGTDLKLPRETRAMVTLGPKVTKDRLLQGCMRMRKLGHGQSVIFAAPPEIDAQIRNSPSIPIDADAPVDTIDILRWTMLETCKDLQHNVSHWAQQGIEFNRRHKAEREYEQYRRMSILEEGWTTPESRPLEQMYGVLSPEILRDTLSFTQCAFDDPELREGLKILGVEKLEDPRMDEEQEREVHHEVEREPQTQRPLKRQPADHSIHSDVNNFIRTGSLTAGGLGIVPLFQPFISSYPQISVGLSRLLFASADFLQTIAESPTDRLTENLRPVNWIVSGPGGIRVVLSPHEVNELLPLIRKSSVVRLHVYAPRVSLSMLSFSHLQFYSIPAAPRSPTHPEPLSIAQLHLDLFAGQLYFSCYQDYALLCATLGLLISSGDKDLDVDVGSDGFVKPEHRDRLVNRHPEYSNCRFRTTPIPALKDFIGQRRKGMGYLLTHVGQILHARELPTDDF
ncbi:hypothetical protein FRC11_011666 [Ceratobasidium sp. 423]|nr:hypothetical protein FRC11_011666 [Ceratobasidium sp. 423]